MKGKKFLTFLMAALAAVCALALAGCGELEGGTVVVENNSSYKLTSVVIYAKGSTPGSLASLNAGESKSKDFSEDTDFVVSFSVTGGNDLVYVNEKTWSGTGTNSVSGGKTFTISVTNR